jgi:hypothetical protein
MSPDLKSTNLYGPVPTGLLLAGFSRERAPMKGSKTCWGRIQPKLLAGLLTQPCTSATSAEVEPHT